VKTVVQHLSDLIRIPSPSFLSNRPVIDYAATALRKAHWYSREIVYRDAAGVEKVNLIAAPAHQDLGDITAELAFFCHTDTVPYSTDWPQALEPFVADGLLHGCGACDVKGFLACLLTSIAESDSSSLIDGLRLILTADEEIGCVGAAHLVTSGLIKPRWAANLPSSRARRKRILPGRGHCLRGGSTQRASAERKISNLPNRPLPYRD
jgi:acetylornithine deacetylase